MVKNEKRFLCRSKDGSIAYYDDGRFLYAEKAGATVRLDLFDRHYYKLRAFNGVPILEVDGVRMHLVRDFRTPLDYSAEVVKGLRIPKRGGHTVLDTCMGLGYTALEAAKSPGVKTVVTCELSPAVVLLSKWNPLSDGLWEKGSKVIVMEGSAAELIKGFGPAMFSFVIHDPPRISHAPELYSTEFYCQLHRVCKRGGRIFHYVGSVGKGKGRRIDQEAGKRLRAAGFSDITCSGRLQGIFAEKR